MRSPFPFMLCIVATLIVVAAIGNAFAADATVPAASLLEKVRPYLVEIASALVLAFVTWLSTWLRATFKVSLDEAHRRALHSALENGARLAIDKLESTASGLTVPVGHPIVAQGVEYVLKYSPDAVAYFGLTPERLGEMIRAKFV